MTLAQERHIVKIHKHLDRARGGGETLVVVDRADTGQLIEAVQLILADADFQALLRGGSTKLNIQSNEDLYAVATAYLHIWLMRQDYFAAATLIWGNEIFTTKPREVRLIWNAIKNNRLLNILGFSSAGKSFNAAAYFMLDWIADPEHTLVRVMSTKEDHLKRNLFAGMQRLFRSSTIPLPGRADTESIATEFGKKAGSGIFVTTLARGASAPPSIKGAKCNPRSAHPVYGSLSRMRFLLDESQEAPPQIFSEVSNLFSSFSSGDMEHIKIVTAANPSDEFSEFGKNCKNAVQWEDIQTRESAIDEWESDTGWHCLRLNALKSENIITGKEIFRGFMTKDGMEAKIKSYGGDIDAPMAWAEIYAMFPPKGHMASIIQKHHVARSYGEWIFQGPTIGLAGEDPALSGDLPAMATGRAGLAVGWRDYAGEKHDLDEPTWKLQIDMVGIMSHGDTQDLANVSMDNLKLLGIQPENVAIDRTGNGQGVFDTMRRQWKTRVDGVDTRSLGAQIPVSIKGVMYTESASEMKICEEDSSVPKDLYEDICSELWYAVSKYFEFDMIRIGRGVDATTISELVTRQGGRQSGKSKKLAVESKKIYKARGNPSCDRADAVTLLVHAARMSVAELIPRAPNTELEHVEVPNVLDEMRNENSGGLKFEAAFDMSESSNFGLSSEISGIDIFKD